MSFISTQLLLLVFATAVIYYIMPKKYQWILLLAVSYMFYTSYGLQYVGFIVFTTITTFLGGVFIDKIAITGKTKITKNKDTLKPEEKKAIKAQIKRNKKLICALILVCNFGILAFLKYFNFVLENINSILTGVGSTHHLGMMSLLLPLGISFYTFQSMGYIIDVFQGKYAAEKNPFKFALFVSFFPQILQGPIGRFDRLACQFFEEHQFELKNIQFGLQLILWGYFKKIVLADRAAVVVNKVFTDYTNYSGFYIIFAVLLYSVELYADFSGGMDVVIGIAQIFGIKLDQNFARPFFSRSISEFWRRWHITLGTWMKDYIFYPFTLSKPMNKFGKFSKKKFGNTIGRVLPICLADLLIFFLVGIWHGAAWKYIAYGMYNGIIIALSSLLDPLYKTSLKKLHINSERKPWKLFQIIRTGILINIGWYFDMGVNFNASIIMMKNTFVGLSLSTLTDNSLFKLGLLKKDIEILAFGCLVWFIISVLQERKINIREALSRKPLVVRWTIYLALIFATPILGYIGASSGFIYAQF